MLVLILGLVLFLGIHSLRIFADDWRGRQIARMGLMRWKVLYAAVAIAGFVLLCWGFGLARQQPVLLYVPPLWLRHLNALLPWWPSCCSSRRGCRATISRRSCITRRCWR